MQICCYILAGILATLFFISLSAATHAVGELGFLLGVIGASPWGALAGCLIWLGRVSEAR